MCDVISQALQAGISRRTLLASLAVGAGTLAAGAAPANATSATRGSGASSSRTRLVLLGTSGGPPWWPGSEREGIASAVVVGDRYYLVDAGHGVGRQVRRARLGSWESDLDGPLDSLAGIFLTHLHSDHVVDLNNLLTEGLFNGLTRAELPVPLIGPGNRGVLPPLFGAGAEPPIVAPDNPTPGTRDMWELMVRTFATDFNDRARDNRKPVPAALVDARDVALPPETTADPNGNPHPRMSPVPVFEDDRVRVTCTLVQHAPVFPALAYRFDTEDGSVTFSGDTGPSDNLVELAQDTDVLVHEVIDRTWPEGLFPTPRDPAQEGLFQHLVNAHTTIEDVGSIAERAGARTLALSHLVPGNRPDGVWRRAKAGFSGRLVVGRDLDVLPVGG